MGAELWERYPSMVAAADAVLGYSIRELCEDSSGRLDQTLFTQPALYVVNALSYQRYLEEHEAPAILLGHSLGEYSALWAAGAFSFEEGLRLVRRRAELMAAARSGKMGVVVGLGLDEIKAILLAEGIDDVEVANHNSHRQIVLAGPAESVPRLKPLVERAGATWFPLNVSGAFHSQLMRPAARQLGEFLKQVTLGALRATVVSNYSARPYSDGVIARLLTLQLANPVRWADSLEWVRDAGALDPVEVGPKRVLTNLLARDFGAPRANPAARGHVSAVPREQVPSLGSSEFLERYGVKYPLVAGAMYRGIASVPLVKSMADAGFLAFFGAGGLSLDETDQALAALQRDLSGRPFGCNLLFQDEPTQEEAMVDLLLARGITNVEASAYVRPTKALLRFKAAGIVGDASSGFSSRRRIIVKLSRVDVAEAFLRPPSSELVQALVERGAIAADVAAYLASVPVADDVVVEADSAGHTDKRHLSTLLPAVVRLRDDLFCASSPGRPCVGAAGGIGEPRAALTAFLLGADFIVTGSINQCTLEAGTSDVVKDLLQRLDVGDTDYAPAGDLFELGASVQVVKKGVFFPARGRKLYELFLHHRGLDELPEETRKTLEQKYFERSIDEVLADVREYHRATGRDGAALDGDPKAQMAAVFKWYLHQTTLYALQGRSEKKLNFQIHCGPALGAFNRWVRGTEYENWRERRVARVSEHLWKTTTSLHAQLVGAGAGAQP
jgi:trans-AT polyketide synthase/acyltransferase/oxidoreductase domain-containing protein